MNKVLLVIFGLLLLGGISMAQDLPLQKDTVAQVSEGFGKIDGITICF